MIVSSHEKAADGNYKALTRLINQHGGRIETLRSQTTSGDVNLDMHFNVGKLENLRRIEKATIDGYNDTGVEGLSMSVQN